jgi:uncharacterized membrane protein YadS
MAKEQHDMIGKVKSPSVAAEVTNILLLFAWMQEVLIPACVHTRWVIVGSGASICGDAVAATSCSREL